MRDITLPILAGIVFILAGRIKSIPFGEGDAYTLAALGLVIGPWGSLQLMAAGLISAGVFTSLMMLAGRLRMDQKIPFVPFLLAGYMLGLIYG